MLIYIFKRYLPILFFFMILSGSLKSQPGQLIDYTHQSTMTQDDINFILWFAGFDPVADFDISVYDIHLSLIHI